METSDRMGRGISGAGMKQSVKALLAGSAILLTGIIIGGAATLIFMSRFDEHMPGPPNMTADDVLDKLRRDLGLSKEQIEAIRPSIVESHGKMESIRMQLEPQVREVMDQADAKIGPVLNPKQKGKWEKRMAEMRKKMLSGAPHGAAKPPDAETNGSVK